MRSSCYHGTDRILKLKSQSEGDGSSENEIHCGGEQSYLPPMGRKVVFFMGSLVRASKNMNSFVGTCYDVRRSNYLLHLRLDHLHSIH